MKVTMMLADAAQAAEGKLYILGGGWSVTGPTPSPSAIALYIQVPWDRTNVEHSFRFDLIDSDGNAVELGTEADVEESITFEGTFGLAGHQESTREPRLTCRSRSTLVRCRCRPAADTSGDYRSTRKATKIGGCHSQPALRPKPETRARGSPARIRLNTGARSLGEGA